MSDPLTEVAVDVDETPTRGCRSCGHPLVMASGFCWNCDPDREQERKAARQRGAMSTARKLSRGLRPGELGPPPKTPEDVIRREAIVSEACATGRISAQVALAITRSDAMAMKAWEALHLLPRIKKLEEQERARQDIARRNGGA